VDIGLLEKLVEDDPRFKLRNLTLKLECTHTNIQKHLHAMGKTWKYGC
jgi:hypothetical protein